MYTHMDCLSLSLSMHIHIYIYICIHLVLLAMSAALRCMNRASTMLSSCCSDMTRPTCFLRSVFVNTLLPAFLLPEIFCQDPRLSIRVCFMSAQVNRYAWVSWYPSCNLHPSQCIPPQPTHKAKVLRLKARASHPRTSVQFPTCYG